MDMSKRPGVTPTRKAEALAMRLALDDRASVEEAGDDRCVDVRDIAFERGGDIHHRHPGDADIVLYRDRRPLQLAAWGAGNVSLHIPRVMRVLLCARPVARGARVFDDRNLVRHLIDEIIGGEVAFHEGKELADALLAHGHAEALDNVRHLFDCWTLHAHELSPSYFFPARIRP